MSLLTLAMSFLSPAFSAATISGDSKVITICFIPCLSRLHANLYKKFKFGFKGQKESSLIFKIIRIVKLCKEV